MYQPSKKKNHKIMPGDIPEWTENERGILVRVRKKRALKDIIGIVKTEGDAVESKKSLQKGFK